MMPSTPSPAGVAPLRWTMTLALRSVGQPMPLAPREVVVVLDVEQHLDAERARDVRVNQRVIRRGVPAHQLHRRPVFLAGLGRRDRATPGARAPAAAPGAARAPAGCSAAPPARRCRGCRSGSAARGTRPARRPTASSSTVSWPNSTKWLPLPLVPSCAHARSFMRAVTAVTRQSASMTSCWRGDWNDAPMPKRVSRSSACVSRA